MKKLFTLSLLAFATSSACLAGNPFAKKQNTEENVQVSPSEAAAKLLKANDGDKDGKLSKKEVNLSFRVKRFNVVDKNKDGFLDEQELVDSYTRTTQASNTKAAE